MKARREPLENVGRDPDPRFSFANERTFLAWIRTALGLIVAGIAVIQLLPHFEVPGGSRALGLMLIGVGAVIAFTSYARWEKSERALRAGTTLPRSRLPVVLAYVVGTVAVAAAVLSAFTGRV